MIAWQTCAVQELRRRMCEEGNGLLTDTRVHKMREELCEDTLAYDLEFDV